jgi:hypothetical protein
VVPGGPVVPLAAAAIIVWLPGTLAVRAMIATLVFVVVTALVYGARQLRRKTCASSLPRARSSSFGASAREAG